MSFNQADPARLLCVINDRSISMDMRLSAREQLQGQLRRANAPESDIAAVPDPMNTPPKVFPPFWPEHSGRYLTTEEVLMPPVGF